MNRHLQRQKTIECLYQHCLLERPLTLILEDYEFEITQDEGRFVLLNCEFIEINKEALVEKINDLLQDWTFERLPFVEQAILLLAVCELERKLDEKPVVIDEAVLLAKEYSDDESYKYINAVLDRYE
jgi:N utilization substance protein B